MHHTCRSSSIVERPHLEETMQVQPLPSASTIPSEPITRSEGQDMAERDAHPYLGHHQELINNKCAGGRMTKTHKKLDRFKLTEEEKKAIRKQERYESTIDSVILVLSIAAGIVVLLTIMEIF